MFCRTACTADADCTAPLGACDATLDYCVQCTDNADCGANQRCTANACEFYCTEDSACAATEFCRTDTGVCAARECESTRDCEGGFRCERFACIPIDDLVCTPDAETCSADNRTVQRCNADGTMQTMETCATDSRCVVNGSSAACAAVVCTPSALGCVDGATAFECDATGTVRTDTPCGSGRFCSMGVCQDLLCAPGSVRCEGNGTVTCDALGSMETFTACADRPECASSAFGCTCAEGACVTRICTPGATRCAAAGFQTCAADGRSWGATAACPAGQTCLVALGACATVTCTAGSRECFGEQLSECNATGTARSTTDCAATGRLCTGTAPTASCTARVCTPGAISCNAANTAVIECDARGAAQTTTACSAGQVCRSGACVTLLCTPGSATTECATPTARRACASDGMSYVATACASGQSCNAGVCAVRCGDGIVGSGETCDDGNTVSGDGCSAVCGLESARSCREKLMVSPGSPSGVYTIDPDGTGPTAPLSVYCDMTSDGGGWTMVVAQFEAFPETNWNRGTTSTYDPTLASGRGFALSTSQIPTHTQTAFGKGTAATFVDYTDYSYSTGNLSATSLRGIRTGVMFQVHRNSASYYYGHDPESMLVASCRDPFCNTLTFDRMGGLLYSWAFSPDRSTPTERGFAMMGDWRSRSDSFAWTVWVR